MSEAEEYFSKWCKSRNLNVHYEDKLSYFDHRKEDVISFLEFSVSLARKEGVKFGASTTLNMALQDKEFNKVLKQVEARVRDKLNEKVDLFFDKQIENIYQKEYGDSEDPMSFDEIKEHLKTWLEGLKND